jgi:hypothetical protein
MAVGYTPYTNNNNLAVCSPSFTPKISTANPSSPNPVQGQYFPNCSFISALASITWVNRNFILNNSNSLNPNASGNYSFTFWDYGPGTLLTLPTSGAGNPVTVTVSPNVLLDGGNQFSNASGFYGAGSSNANEVWPALYERAYAKFCYYENGITQPSTGQVLTAANLTNTACDPTFSDVQSLTAVQWGGNGGIALAYLTGLPCVSLITTQALPVITTGGISGIVGTGANGQPSSATAANASAGGKPLTSMCSLYSYLKAGFCNYSAANFQGINKTAYPLIATTWASAAASPNSGYVTYGGGSLIAGHGYSILGVLQATSGGNTYYYIVLRTTFGSNSPIPPGSSGVATNTWPYYDAQFAMGTTVPYQPTSPKATSVTLPVTANSIFAMEQGAFINYFQSIAWAY